MKKIFIIALFSMGSISSVMASSGRTDAYGCHTESATGHYHCH